MIAPKEVDAGVRQILGILRWDKSNGIKYWSKEEKNRIPDRIKTIRFEFLKNVEP